jgi:uncharacterized protein YkwD
MKFDVTRILLFGIAALAIDLPRHGSADGQQPPQQLLRGVRVIQQQAKRSEPVSDSGSPTLRHHAAPGTDEDAHILRSPDVHGPLIEDEASPVDAMARELQSMVMSDLERANAGYIQTARKQRGLPGLSFSADLVTEARRWAAVMAGRGRIANRDPMDANVDAGWKRIGEIPGKYGSVAPSGAVLSMLQQNSAMLLDARYNRIGVGITKGADGAFYVMVLLKQV